MTADVSPDAPRPPSGIRDSGGPMPFNEADFTRDAARLVAEGDAVPKQRENGHMSNGDSVWPSVGDTTIVGATIYDAATGEVFANLVPDETGELVEADPGDAIIGVVLTSDGGRWLLHSEADSP